MLRCFFFRLKGVGVFSTVNSFCLEQEGDVNVNFEGAEGRGEGRAGKAENVVSHPTSVFWVSSFRSYPPKTKYALSRPLH